MNTVPRFWSLSEIARRVGGRVQGSGDTQVRSFATLQNAGSDSISFLSNSHYRKYLGTTAAAAVIVSAADAADCPVPAIIADNPYVAYAKAAQLLAPPLPVNAGIHPHASVAKTAVIDASAEIAAGAVIEAGVRVAAGVVVGPNCVIKRNASVADDARLVANVSICESVQIGPRALFHPGVVIGADGFGIADDGERWIKVPQIGSVVIGADVEIGANTTVDRGAIENTVIEDGVKLDNQVQIGHNVRIGAHSALAGCCGISGSSTIGRHCILGGRAGMVGHISIADNTVVMGATIVSHTIREPGIYAGSMPMDTYAHWRRNSVRFKQLDDMARRLRVLEKKLKDKDR